MMGAGELKSFPRRISSKKKRETSRYNELDVINTRRKETAAREIKQKSKEIFGVFFFFKIIICFY
jgi:hypothetical protein